MSRDPVAKAFRALSCLIQHPEESLGVRELAPMLGLSPSGAHRVLSALLDEGMIRRDPVTARYSLAVEFYRLANLAAAKAPIRRVALKHMRSLVDACNETALLAIYDRSRQEMTFVANVECTHPLRFAVALNEWLPIHVGASGLAIMAFLPHDEIQAIIARTRLEPATEASITDPCRLEAALQQVRARGWACTRGQRLPGATGLAAPIFAASGEVVGDICLTVPAQRIDRAGENRMAERLIECARRVTSELNPPTEPLASPDQTR